MAAVLYCNGTIICNFGEKSGSLLGKNPASMGGSLASTKKKPYYKYLIGLDFIIIGANRKNQLNLRKNSSASLRGRICYYDKILANMPINKSID